MQIIKRKKSKQQGATMVEYSIMVAFIAIAVAVTVILVKGALIERYEEVSDCVASIADGSQAADCPGAEGQQN
jgi:Flp pilus assembly pilin Flp